ncbi:Protein of unknown function [Lactobacillus acidophilus DSM 20079 = JCM 1132 = NBRC 13951 = CIP 76.13]|nr:Protein of unknown function [Lactobacillus acidophilus DSM 20079 = JCM 1132 = NBRC 13951 = CIP 76.13]CDF68593.1 Protein of unknown function [Lactobacillus acidophilus CIRM-BIA 442]
MTDFFIMIMLRLILGRIS